MQRTLSQETTTTTKENAFDGVCHDQIKIIGQYRGDVGQMCCNLSFLGYNISVILVAYVMVVKYTIAMYT